MLFDVIYGWRKWREQRGFWSLLVVSLCFFCCLIGLVVNLFWLLSSDRPKWVANQQAMMTIAKKDLSGNLQPSSGYDIDLVQRLAGVERVASIAIESSSVSLGLKELPKVTIGFYSQSALDLLGLAAPFSLQNFEAKKGIVSQRFWQQHLESQSALSDTRLYYRDSAFLLAGVAPQSMQRLGDADVDIWLPDSYLQLKVPDMFVDNPQLYLNTLSNRYGFALLSKQADVALLQHAYRDLRRQTPWPEGGFSDKYYQPWLISGMELNPNGRQLLQRQAWILVGLLVGFGFIIFSGIVSAYSQQGIARHAEMSLKLALGANRRGLIVQLLRENLPALFLVAGFSPLLGLVITHFVGNISVYQKYFVEGIDFNIWLWLIAVICSLSLFIVCALMPLLGSLNTLFSRGKQSHMTKLQLGTKKLILVLQLAVITAVMMISLSLMYQELQKYSSVAIAKDVVSYQPRVDGRLSVMLTVEQFEGNWSVGDSPIALSSAQFTQLGAPSLKYQPQTGEMPEKPINGLYVSHNFFSLLGIPALYRGQLAENAVIINRTMAMQLAIELGLNDWRAAKDVALKVTGFYYEKQVRVAGIVNDSPHFGIANEAKPLIYLSLKDQNPLLASRIAPVFYSNEGNSEAIASHLNDWALLLSPKLRYAEGRSVIEQIEDTDTAGKLLFLTSSTMALLILFLVVFTLYNKFSYAVKSEQLKWAIMLAVGGKKQVLIARMIWTNLLLSLLAIMLTIGLFILLEGYSLSLVNVSLFQPLIWGICIVTTLCFIIVITLWAARGVLRQNISALLRG
ncbi:hypothetical protein TUM4438_07890 [Shewanella sairae]|uniref:ABC3 transporter permease C-terminal domain-containing protein n=1 Tax=Shewanella sairae TaxID=190310 RepID=A0ABQ4P3S7_9GAMM|nr:FtsX-like permease family protein [Shewanella sairae]MCL1128537.1 hypothetical protein [Shewanella sairae]GIU42106.1 hypothetical protein TUM4438_07890 [Shewanella sairae]